MDSEDPEKDGKINICPICDRDFTSVAGLRQHWTKGHSDEEIQAAITTNTQDLSQHPTQPENEINESIPASISFHSRNKLQIMNDDINQQFNIIENEAGGDCLFMTLMEFLNINRTSFNNVPSHANELRKMAVNYVLSQDINRFKDSIIANLENEIPGLLKKDKNDDSNSICEENYSNYMSTPGKYGTVVELCALAELFGFDFYVIRQNSAREFICYNYGSTVTAESDMRKRSVHMLFTGNINSGHFRLLNPTADTRCSIIVSGKYELVKDYTSSRLTSIALASTVVQSRDRHNITFDQINGKENRTSSNFSCNVCNRSFTSQRGLNIHRHCHDDAISSTSATEPQQTSESHQATNNENTDPEFFVKLLSRCKRNIRVLKRIPRGARILAANKLSQCIEECLANPKSDKKWEKLLTFAYTALQVPEKTSNISLTTLVKRNTDSTVLNIPKSSKQQKQLPISISRRVEYKISDGDVKGAVKILSSMDTLAPQNEDTLNRLRFKHPPPSKELHFPDPPDINVQPLVVSEKEVLKKIGNFPNGSASGVDGILPQHLKDMTSPYTGEAGLRLLRAINSLSNFMLTGKLPSKLCEIMYGAALCALNKEDGGIRPIAIGNTFRRLTSKLACTSVRAEMSSKFVPKQVGFGIRGGCEAAAHATRTFIKKHSSTHRLVVKIDFRNAFNEIDRDKFPEEMKLNCPTIYPFLWQCYSSSTLLFYGEDTILSQNGAQQGDPCGPLLFCSAIQVVVESLISEFVAFYLDDGVVAGSYDTVLQDFKTIIEECGKIGLHVNTEKCELYFCSEVDQEIVNQFNEISPGIRIVRELTLLGAPISDNAFEQVFNKKWNEMQLLIARLIELDNNHIAFYLLKNCFSIPKLIYLLRVTPTWNNGQIIEEMDAGITSALEVTINAKLDQKERVMSSLPVRCGGLGVRRIQDTALPAFLSSINSVSQLVSFILQNPTLDILDIAGYQDCLTVWNALNPGSEQPKNLSLQQQWDTINVTRISNELEFETDEDKARVLAIRTVESGAWLHALPSRTIGTLLENNTFRIIVALRLGLDICVAHTCIYGSKVDRKGRHGLSCRKSAGRFPRQNALNNIIKKALASADIPSKLEPLGLCSEDGKRVDGLTLISWSRGSSLIWDATCTDTMAPSNIKSSVREAGRAAENRARFKELKYMSLINQNYHFVPFSVETLGPWSMEAIKFFNELCKRITIKTNEPRTRSFLQQRISIAIQRTNAASVMGTFSDSETAKMEEIFYLL